MATRPYLSIGEVLTLLKDEFPDVTISKIRFLESQGLLDPERTPSGYRKFYDNDVARLRWILRQQREHFLPLKVIKGRLIGDAESEGEVEEQAAAAGGVMAAAMAAAAAEEPEPLSPPRSGTSLNLQELAASCGLETSDIKDLERFGLITSRTVAGTAYYDDDALAAAHVAAGFMKFGVEARHLRMYKTAAEREAGFFEQVVMPMLKQRNPEARRQATETLAELARLGQQLRSTMLRNALRDYLEE
ncbi:MAG: MerR family transcriptional regulator [Acidimicrobiia bacterium]|nr:MerR family transcriptional regulator [Acidimicrobiia bacterium]MBV9042580.1 MerR family transcriptional regulator [Acidimicrobiia bacterium]MBV9284136.1 MerR family transcriptional regulator [Acidimicrobiia bacterium]